MGLILYELGGEDGRRYSQFSWRARLALAHKGLEAETRPVRVSDKAAIAFSGQDKVPILVDGPRIVCDSWQIADYLETLHPDRPTLFGGDIGRSLTHFINAWVDRQLIPRLVPLLMADVVAGVDAQDASHLRQQIEKAFGSTLEELALDRDRELKTFRRLLDPARAILRSQAFLSGATPAYADYILFSLFQWARIVSKSDVLEASDRLAEWRGRMLDLFDGLALAHGSRARAPLKDQP